AYIRDRRDMRVAALSTLAVVLICTTAAEAFTPRDVYGRPGKVIMPVVRGNHGVDQIPVVDFPAVGKVYRSPMAPRTRQKICISYRVWSYDNYAGWLPLETEAPACTWTPRGYHMVPNDWSVQVEPNNGARATAVITWQTTTRLLARETVDWNQQGDYSC